MKINPHSAHYLFGILDNLNNFNILTYFDKETYKIESWNSESIFLVKPRIFETIDLLLETIDANLSAAEDLCIIKILKLTQNNGNSAYIRKKDCEPTTLNSIKLKLL